MLSFLNVLSMAFRKSEKPGQNVCWFSEEESFETILTLFRRSLVMVDCIFVSECRNRLIVLNLDSFCNLVKLLRALNKSLYRFKRYYDV
jgi:hypothetical protein